jgi:hypothetical protein
MSVILNALGHPATKREVRITDPKLATFAAFADDAFRKLNLGVVCPDCRQPPVCNNAVTDTHWRMECACCVRILRNPGVH